VSFSVRWQPLHAAVTNMVSTVHAPHKHKFGIWFSRSVTPFSLSLCDEADRHGSIYCVCTTTQVWPLCSLALCEVKRTGTVHARTSTTERRASCRARAPGLVLWWWSSRVRCDIDAPRNIYSISWPRRARCGADEREADARNRGVSGNKTCVAPGERSGSRPDLMRIPCPRRADGKGGSEGGGSA
jgi:hypothetical protein